MIVLTRKGRQICVSPTARILLEVANGTSSYTLVRGFSGVEAEKALKAYDDFVLEPNQHKRLTAFDDVEGKRVRTVVDRA